MVISSDVDRVSSFLPHVSIWYLDPSQQASSKPLEREFRQHTHEPQRLYLLQRLSLIQKRRNRKSKTNHHGIFTYKKLEPLLTLIIYNIVWTHKKTHTKITQSTTHIPRSGNQFTSTIEWEEAYIEFGTN